MNILFCCDPLNNKKVDLDWEHEYQMAKRHDMKVILLDYDAYKNSLRPNAIKVVNKPENIEPIVYRGWMMPVDLYTSLYNDLKSLNLQLINSPEEYEHCYYLPRSYELIRNKTPMSVFYPGHSIPEDEQLAEIMTVFGSKPIIVKDYVKSQKHYWKEACFIPDASNIVQVKNIVNKFIELQGDSFQGGLVFREFIDLEPIGTHSKSQMPLTKEYRLFILNKKLITCSEYWKDGEYGNSEQIDYDEFNDIFESIRSNFFTVDIAKKKGGGWMIIELGDGQVAEFLGKTGLDNFYEALSS